MPLFGKIVVIKRNGTDGTHFPLTANSCLFGRKKECDIRIQMPQVSKEHCKIEVNENKEAVLFNLSSTNPTQLNGNCFQDPTHLNHGDVLTIIDRSFRFEYPPHSFPQKRLSRSQEKETLQILHVQHMQQVELLHPQNSDYKSSPLTGKELESHPLSNEKQPQEQYSTPEFKYKMHNTEKTNEMSPFSKLYELMKYEGGIDSVKEDTGNETFLEDVFHSTSRMSAVSRAKLAKVEHSEDSKIQEKGSRVANPVPILFEEKDSEKSSSIQSCGIKQKQECEGTNQSDFKYTEDHEVGKSQIIKSANKYAHFKENRQSAQHFPESCCIVSLDHTEKARCPNKINLTDAFTSVESILPKPKSSRRSTQSYSSPCSRNSRRSSKSRRSWAEIDSLKKMKSSEVMEECSVQVRTEQPEADILIENIYSKTNENRELATETMQNLKDSEDGNSSIVFSSLHFNISKNCNSSIELNKNISNEYSCIEAIDTEESVTLPVDPSQTNGIMANQIPEKNLETGCPTKENKIKITIEGHEQNVNIKNNIPAFSSSNESNVQTSAKDDAVFEMNLSCPLKVIKKSEPKKSPKKRKGTELDLLVQPLGKRKRVSFGGQLSPELFDKRLPPNSPLKKGAIPARLSMPFGNTPRAVLKKASELRQSVIKGSFERKQHENIVTKQTASHSVPQRKECFSVARVAKLSSEDEEATAQEMRMNRLFAEVQKTECDDPESKATSSLRRSKPCTPRRSSILGKSGAMDAIRSKRQSGASEANLIVAKTWAEVVKQGVPKLQLKSASKQSFKRRSVKKVPSKPSKNINLLKTPKRKISGHFTTGHANSPVPIVIGKAHTGIVNTTAQVPKVVINYPLKQHSDFNESFTGLAEMFHTPPNGKQKSFVLEAQTSRPEIMSEMNASEESEKESVLNFNISSQKRHYNQDVTFPVLEEVSQISILEQGNLKMTTGEASGVLLKKSERKDLSLNEGNIMGMEEEDLQQESEPVKVHLGVKRVLKIPKEKSEPVEAFSEVKRLLRTPKQKSEPVEAFLGVKRLFRTPKQKSEPVEALSGVKRLLRTPKQKSELVEALSGVKRLLKTPKRKSEPMEALSGVKRLLRTPKQKSEPVEALSGVKRLLKTPKRKSDPVEALSGVKRLLRTPRRNSEPVEVLSGIKTLLKTPKQNIESLVDDIYTKSMVSTDEVLKNMIVSVTKKKTKQRIQPMEDTSINNITEEFKETVKPMEDRESIQLMTPKQRFEPINNMVGISQTLKTSKLKSVPADDYLGLQKFMIEPKESSISPEIDYTGVKEMLDTENEHKAELPESVNLMEENGSYITSRNELESMENVSGSCKANLEVTFERQSHFPVTKNNSRVPNHVGHVACNSFNELKTEFDEETTRIISLSESYKPDGMSSKNEAKTDFVKEAAANPDALDSEKLEPPALGRTRRGKINDCSSAVYTKKIQRPTKNTHRTRSANRVQTSESFDSHTELNPINKSESNFTTIETKTKQSQRGRPKKLPVKTNENIGSDNISCTQELQKPSKKTTVEKQPVNRRKVATKRNGKIEASMSLEENGPTQENEGDLTAKTWLRSRSVKKSASDLKTECAKDKTDHAMSGEESIKRNRRGKIAAIQSNPETLITAFKEHKQGRQKVQHKSRILKTETSENNLTATKENLVRKGKGKKVHFLLKNDFKVSEEKCALGYEDNAHEEKDSTFLESSVSPKENTSQSCKRKAVPLKTQVICGSYFKEKCTLENCKDSHKQDIHVSFENVTPTEYLPVFNSSFVQEKSMMEIQTENISNGIPKVPLESMQTPTEHNPPRREKLAKKNQPGRGRGKKAISSPSKESDSKLASDVKDYNRIVTLKENCPKRGRGRKIVQVLPKPSPLENTAFGEEDSTMNSFPSAQGVCSLPQIQNEKVKEAEKMPLESVKILEKHVPPKRVVDNPPRRSRSKQVNETSSNEAADVQDPNMAISQADNPSKRGRRKRDAPESSSLKSQRTVKENPPRRGRHKWTMSGEISTDDGSTQTTAIKGQNIVGKNACPAKGNQPKMSGRRKITLVFQKTLSPVENDTVHLLSSNKGKHSAEQPNEGLKTANNANGNFSRKCRERKADDEISASSVSSSKSSKLIDNDIQENRMKDLQGVAKQNISRRSKRKQLTPSGTSTESNDELRINSRKTEPVTNKVDPLENSFEKKHQSKKQREETTIASLVSPSLKVSITLSPLSSANENQSRNCKRSVRKGKLAKHSDTYNIMTRSVRGKCMVPKEEFFHENQNRDLEKTAMASENNQRRGRRKVKELEAAVSPSLKEKCILSAGSDIVPNDQIMILNNVSNKNVSLMGKGQKFLETKTMTRNTNQNNSSNYDQNKNVERSNMLVQKSSSKWGKRKQINSNSETNATANTMKNVFPENKSTTSKTENTESMTVQTRGKKKMKEENTTLAAELPGETEGRTRASKRIRK